MGPNCPHLGRRHRPGTRRRQPTSGHTRPVTSAVYSPDGKSIVTASDDQTARIWDAATGQELEGVSPLSGHTRTVTSAAYSPDGKFIVTASATNCPHLGRRHRPGTAFA